MVNIHSIDISPPLINSSCAWASDFAQLRELYDSPYTGAVTTRTATLHGFEENETHTVVFAKDSTTSLNSYGYSPHPLRQYIDWIFELLTRQDAGGTPPTKPIIISITESYESELYDMVLQINQLRRRLSDFHRGRPSPSSVPDPSTLVAVELNTSCPNITNHPPPSYSPLDGLSPLLLALAASFATDPTLTIGLKLPPYVYAAQFKALLDTVARFSSDINEDSDKVQRVNPIAYIACSNTLGSSLMFTGQVDGSNASDAPLALALPTAYGGLAGEAIHPLALGNVHAFAQLIPAHADSAVREIKIIGIGGVTSTDAVSRMHAAGAHAVGCATMLGRHGVDAFRVLAAATQISS